MAEPGQITPKRSTNSPTDPRSSRRLRLVVHLPLLGVIGFNMLLGQSLILAQPPRLLPREILVLGLASLAHVTALLLALTLLLGLLTSLISKAVAAVTWALATTASCVFWLDSFGYRWLDLHFDETVMLLLWNLRADFLVMRSKLFLAVLSLLLLLGLFAAVAAFYRGTTGRYSWSVYPVPWAAFGLCSFVSALSLIALGGLMRTYVSDTTQYWFRQAEWPVNFVTGSRAPLLTIEHPRFRSPPEPSFVEAELSRLRSKPISRRPNIFLFTVESLRADAISVDGTPNLFQLRQESLSLRNTEANGNCTHIAWISLFNSSSPLFWSLLAKSSDPQGALPLRMLKALGYRLSVLATPDLHYFGSDRILFGQDLALVDSLVDQTGLTPDHPAATPADLDRVVMGRLSTDLDQLAPDSGQFFAVFLDAPHHDYSWPRDFPPKYEPFLATVNLFKTQYSENELQLLRNRYLNSVAFVDSLIGTFIRKLKQRGLWDDSIVVIVGDHGEEFMERGHLTHSSELNRFQTSITMLLRVAPSLLPSPPQAEVQIASQVDIFPTILDVLGAGAEASCLLSGTSLLGPQPPRSAVAARCTSFAPKQVMLLDGNQKLLLEFDGIASTNVAHGLHARRLRVVDLFNQDDERITRSPTPLPLGLAEAVQALLMSPDERGGPPSSSPDRRTAARLETRSPYCRQ